MQPYSFFSLGSMLLVSIQEDIGDAEMAGLVDSLARQVRAGNIRGVIVDLQHVEVMDSYMAGFLQTMARTLNLQNARMVVVGLAVPVVMTLTAFGITFKDMEFALDVEKAVAKLDEKPRARAE